MANVISVNVYDFGSTGNSFYAKRLMGLPVEGMYVRPVAEDERRTLDARVYVYSKITYPNSAPASEPQLGYWTAESVQSIIDKANA